jgi:hypothetical protein
LYYNGNEPNDFPVALRQALLYWNWNISGFLGFGDISITTTSNSTAGGGSSSPAPAPTPIAPRAMGPTVSGIQKSEKSKSRVNPTAPIVASLAAVILIVVATFVVRRRKQNSDDSISKHRELVDDDGDGLDPGMETDIDPGMETDEYTADYASARTPPKSYVVGDGDSTFEESHQGQEVFAASLEQHQEYEDFRQAPHHQCSSPNCDACEAKRQQGIKFVTAETGFEHAPHLPPNATRDYDAEDTVSL